MTVATTNTELVRWFSDLTLDDIPSVGGKNASLGEMVRELTGVGVQVPNGFAVTAEAYRQFVERWGLEERIRKMLDGVDMQDVTDLARRTAQVRQAIVATPLPADLQEAILKAYVRLADGGPADPAVAVRSAPRPRTFPMPALPGNRKPT